MGTYRVSRPLSPTSLLLDTSPGVSDDGAPITVLRFKDPWTSTGFFERHANWQRGWLAAGAVEGLVGFVEAGQAGSVPCVVQAGGERESVRAALRASGKPFSGLESVAVVLQLARGLAALEAQGVTHGDVACASAVLGLDGSARLEAIGVAAATPPDATLGPARSELTCLSREEASGERGAKSDVFRLGLVLLELLTGKLPFSATTWAEVKTRYENFPAVTAGHFANLPSPTPALLVAMLARSPAARPSATELVPRLTHALAELGASSAQAVGASLFARVFPNRPPSSGGQTGVILNVTAPSVRLARIGTKRVTAEEMAAVKEQEASEAAKAAAREWLGKHARDAGNPKDFALGGVLLEQAKASVAVLEEALSQAQSLGGTLFEALVSLQACDEDEVLPLAAGQLKQAFLTGSQLISLQLGSAQAGLLPREVAEDWTVLPLRSEGGALTLAMLDPSRLEVLDDVKRRGKVRAISPVRATERTIREGLARVYDGKTSPPEWVRKASAPVPLSSEFELDGGPLLSPGSAGVTTSPYAAALLGPPASAPRRGSSPFAPPPSAPRPFSGAGTDEPLELAKGAGGYELTLSPPPAPAPPPAPSPYELERAASPVAASPYELEEATAAKASTPQVVAPRSSAPQREGSHLHPDPGAREGRGSGVPAAKASEGAKPAYKTEAALAGSLDVSLRLFDALLAMNGERGLEASAMIALVRSVAKQAGATGAPLDQVRLSVTAVCAGALLEGRRAFEVPSRPSVAAALGPFWADYEDFIRPLLDGTELPKDPRGVVISLCFEVAQEVGGVPKTTADAGPVLERLRSRYPLAALAALEIVLAGA